MDTQYTLAIDSIWLEGEYTVAYVIDWDFDNWVEYGTVKAKGKHSEDDILAMIYEDDERIEYVED